MLPDLATGSTVELPGTLYTPDPISATVDSALTVLAEVAHRGLRESLPPSLQARLTEISVELRRIGLRTPSDLVQAFADAPAPATWLAAHLRVLVTAEFR